MYDFHEFLGRGIIAARAGRTAEALKYLDIAAGLSPGNPRVWLWMASALDTKTQKLFCLNRVLELDPDHLAARALVQRLQTGQTRTAQGNADVAVFACPNCGGRQMFDPDCSALVCYYCHRSDSLLPVSAADAEEDLQAALQKESGNWSVFESQTVCGACGARLTLPAEQSSVVCPFCFSDHVIIQPATPGLMPPNALGFFQLHAQDVRLLLSEWWQETFFASARQSQQMAKQAHLAPLYLPFWSFDGSVQILCFLNRRVFPTEYSNTDRVISLGEWPRTRNWYECDLDDLLVYAGSSALEEDIAQITPFDTKSVYEFHPRFLVGWQAEMYQVPLQDATVVAHKRMRDEAFRSAAHRLLFMDPANMLQQDVRIEDRTFRLLLLPVWFARYTFCGQVYTASINGQTGKIGGGRPGKMDWLRARMKLF